MQEQHNQHQHQQQQQHEHNSTLYATMRPASGGKSLVTLSTYEERQEALQRTTMMEDDVNHRKSRNLTTMSAVTPQNPEKGMNGADHHVSKNTLPMHLPPPPPSFANNIPAPKSSAASYKTSPLQQQQSALKPPNSPVPDYDNVQLRGTNTSRPASVMYANTNARESAASKGTPSATSNRYTMRSGLVTIGQYEHQRKEPGKFDFLTTLKRNNNNNNQHVNGSVDESDAQNAMSLQSELQSTLSRANLKKSNGQLEHQSNCPLQHAHNEQYQYRNSLHQQQQQQQQQLESVQLITRKMQETQLQQQEQHDEAAASTTITNMATLVKPHNGTGILKNGTRSRTGSITRSTEKSIKFGN